MKAEKAVQTFDGPRYIDNILDGTAREVKSGFISNTSDVQRQILKDIDIVQRRLSLDVQRIQWHCLNGVDDGVLQFIKTELTNRNLSTDLFKVMVY